MIYTWIIAHGKWDIWFNCIVKYSDVSWDLNGILPVISWDMNGINYAKWSIYRGLMGFYTDFMGFYSDVMGFYTDFIGFYSDFMGYE